MNTVNDSSVDPLYYQLKESREDGMDNFTVGLILQEGNEAKYGVATNSGKLKTDKNELLDLTGTLVANIKISETDQDIPYMVGLAKELRNLYDAAMSELNALAGPRTKESIPPEEVDLYHAAETAIFVIRCMPKYYFQAENAAKSGGLRYRRGAYDFIPSTMN